MAIRAALTQGAENGFHLIQDIFNQDCHYNGATELITFIDNHDSHVGERIKGQTIVRVQLNGVHTQPGATIVVTGDCPELGNWDISKAYPLEYINANNESKLGLTQELS